MLRPDNCFLFADMSLVKQDRAAWENEYQAGKWENLANSPDFARYKVVAGWIHSFGPSLSLLDVGCGHGVMLQHLHLERINHFTGLDIAESALNAIQPKREQDSYVCSPIEEFKPSRKWDVILFNEVLYYMHDPVSPLRQFEKSLSPNGFFVISMHKKNNPLAFNNKCLRKVRRFVREAGYEMLDGVEIRRLASPTAWELLKVRPRNGARQP